MSYYKKIVCRKKLIRFWVFFGNNAKNIFRINFHTLNFMYDKSYFAAFRNLTLNLKNIIPIFLNNIKNKGNFLFISTKFFYCQSIYKNYFFSIVKKLLEIKSGIFTNFSVSNFKFFEKLNFKLNPDFVLFFSLKNNKNFLLESKKKNIPTIAILTPKCSSFLIEYPLIVNNLFFYIIYFFHKFFFKLILLHK